MSFVRYYPHLLLIIARPGRIKILQAPCGTLSPLSCPQGLSAVGADRSVWGCGLALCVRALSAGPPAPALGRGIVSVV